MLKLAQQYARRADEMEKAYMEYGSGIDSEYWPDVRLVNTPGMVVYLRERAEALKALASPKKP